MIFLSIRNPLYDNNLRITLIPGDIPRPGLRPSDSFFNFGSFDPIGPPDLRVFSRLR